MLSARLDDDDEDYDDGLAPLFNGISPFFKMLETILPSENYLY